MPAILNSSLFNLHHHPLFSTAVLSLRRHHLNVSLFSASRTTLRAYSTSSSSVPIESSANQNVRTGRSGSATSPPVEHDTAQKIDVNPPKGTRDFPPEDMRLRNWLFHHFREVSQQFGFEEVDFPVLESEALYIRKAGEEIRDQLYCFEDRGNRRVALRPELTPSLARLVIQKGKSVSLPLKWFAIGQCWRYERMTRGRRREHYQWNMDVIGVPDVTGEAELISSIITFFKRIGLTASDVGFKVLQEVLRCYSVPENMFGRVCIIIDKIGKIPMDDIRKDLLSADMSEKTKLEEWSSLITGQLWGNRWASWAESKANGTRGGIIILWDKRNWVNISTHQGIYTVSCMLESVQENFRWCFTRVYGPHTNIEREDLWYELAAIRGLWDDSWVIGGDFNVCRLKGSFYTWTRGDDPIQASIIDRFLISPEWNDCFNAINQLALPSVVSDHRPILLKCGDWESNPSYFKFENMWLEEEGFLEKVKTWWQSYSVTGTPDFILYQKLRYLKKDISNWNREIFGKIDTNRNRALEELIAIEHASENRAHSPEEKSKVLCLKLELQKLAKIEEVSWRQKSRCLWLKEGDKNTKYFQKVANGHRRNNTIDKLKIGEVIVDDKVAIKEEILRFYQQLYTENEPWRPTVSFENMASISLDERDWLERNFEEEEIHATIKACTPDKAPGPDGFTMAFFQKAWEPCSFSPQEPDRLKWGNSRKGHYTVKEGDALESWSSRDVDKAIKNMSMMIPGAIFWCLWTERNKRCFDGISTSRDLLRGR
ncbi:hypothetical protein H5410_018761 [Solanum commersonii]|uniref:histidine--tRNA ligase n=1 Tax=Solanum commersonii TaxID=4109 RepID=A0A9J6A329_SOLCO|nr:hypothetical protein H5410_018761 [Solanum commersonii]